MKQGLLRAGKGKKRKKERKATVRQGEKSGGGGEGKRKRHRRENREKGGKIKGGGGRWREKMEMKTSWRELYFEK